MALSAIGPVLSYGSLLAYDCNCACEKAASPAPPEEKRGPKGFFQAPFGYFNLGLGARGFIRGDIGKINGSSSAYDTVKNEYESDPGKYWQGVVGIDEPRLFYRTDDPHRFSFFHAGLQAYVDLGQFRLGNEPLASGNSNSMLIMQYVRDTWGTDVTIAGEFSCVLKSRNYFLAGVNLFKKDAISYWLNYGLDRYEFEFQNKVYREVDNPYGQNREELLYTDHYGGGTGWGHRLFLDIAIGVPEDLTSRTTSALTSTFTFGANVGKLAQQWFYQFTIAYNLGFQVDFLSNR